MPAPVSINDFLELGYKSGLLEKTAVEAWRQRAESGGQLPEKPKELAEALVRDGLLTNFQADHLLAGKWRGSFRRVLARIRVKTLNRQPRKPKGTKV